MMSSGRLKTEYDPPLDPGIQHYVEILAANGIETYESCEGGEGHAFLEPTIRFGGERGEGFKALSIAMDYRFPVYALRRVWSIEDGEPVGPNWEITFAEKSPVSPQETADLLSRFV